jgi:precorrin-2 dehydrogenase/sirohydrochlorin ferrochelatase
MIPILLDPSAARIALVGRGALAERRLAWLKGGGATPDVWSDAPSAELATAAGDRLKPRLPLDVEITSYHAIWIADLAHAESEALARAARGAGVLVNVEDAPAFCDFHTPAVVRRGKLTLAAGTGGASPAVARAAREKLEVAFPPAWEDALDEIAASRAALREGRASLDALVEDARQRLTQRGLI